LRGNTSHDEHRRQHHRSDCYAEYNEFLHIAPKLSDDLECSGPASLAEEVRDQVGDLLDAIFYACSTVLVGIRFERPVDNQGLADNQIAGNEAPVTAVGAVVAIISHRKVVVGWHDEFAVLFEIFVPVRVLVRTFIAAVGVTNMRISLRWKEIAESV